MSQVFIAYKKVDLAQADVVRKKLHALGVSLFIDQEMDPGNYVTIINSQLAMASAVLVLWTEAAATMDPNNFVIGEASRGRARGILVAATFKRGLLDQLPVPFNTFHTFDLSDWIENGALTSHPQWQQVLKAIGVKIKRPLLELALAIDDAGIEAKRKFLRAYPNDAFAANFAADIAVLEKASFEQEFRAARDRISRRAKSAEKMLQAHKERFDGQLEELRAGREFKRPDLSKIVNDDIDALRQKIEEQEQSHRSLQVKLADAEGRASEGHHAAALDQAKLVRLQEQFSDAQTATSAATQLKARSESLEKELTKLKAAMDAPRVAKRPWPFSRIGLGPEGRLGLAAIALVLIVLQLTFLAVLEVSGASRQFATVLASVGLHSSHTNTSRLTAEFAAREAKLAADSIVLEKQRQEVGKQKKDIDTRNSELNNWSAKIELQQTQNDADRQEFRKRMTETAQREKAAAVRETKLATDTELLAKQSARLQTQTAQVEQNLSEQAKLRRDLDAQGEQQNKKTKELDARDASINDRLDQLKGWKTQLDVSQREIASKQNGLSKQQKELEETASRRDDELTRREQGIADKEKAFRKKELATVGSGSIQNPPPVDPPNPLENYSVRNNRDIYGYDIRTSTGRLFLETTLPECATTCDTTDSCVAFSYDRWKQACYLKDTVGPALLLDARSTVGLRKTFSGSRAVAEYTDNPPMRIDPPVRRRLKGDVFASDTATSVDTCKVRCASALKCVGFNYFEKGNICEMLGLVNNFERDNDSRAGYKTQLPP